jgi:signal transduction histidine kinase
MARRLACAILLTLGTLMSIGAAAANSGDTGPQAVRANVLLVGAIAGAELLLIIYLLRSRSKSQSVTRAEFGGRLIQAQEKERTRIARELHDDINQRLALLANGVERVIETNGNSTKAEQTQELRDLWQLTNEIATDLQHLSHQLHPSKLHYLGLATAVRDLCKEFSHQHRIDVQSNVTGLPGNLDDEVSLSLFRTVQEALRNVARHSRASRVKVELIQDSGVVTLRVADNGAGFIQFPGFA